VLRKQNFYEHLSDSKQIKKQLEINR
jgi:hypothetical protein